MNNVTCGICGELVSKRQSILDTHRGHRICRKHEEAAKIEEERKRQDELKANKPYYDAAHAILKKNIGNEDLHGTSIFNRGVFEHMVDKHIPLNYDKLYKEVCDLWSCVAVDKKHPVMIKCDTISDPCATIDYLNRIIAIEGFTPFNDWKVEYYINMMFQSANSETRRIDTLAISQPVSCMFDTNGEGNLIRKEVELNQQRFENIHKMINVAKNIKSSIEQDIVNISPMHSLASINKNLGDIATHLMEVDKFDKDSEARKNNSELIAKLLIGIRMSYHRLICNPKFIEHDDTVMNEKLDSLYGVVTSIMTRKIKQEDQVLHVFVDYQKWFSSFEMPESFV